MKQTPIDVVMITQVASLFFWILVVVGILVAGQWKQGARDFRDRMVVQWKPALTLAVLFLVGMAASGTSILNFHAITVFCQSLVGFAITKSIGGFEPLPVTNAILQRERAWRKIGSLVIVSLVTVLPILLAGSAGMYLGQHLFGETSRTAEIASAFPANKWLAFFVFLSGGGIAEESPYRLVVLSLIWRLTHRKWLAILLSAVLFGAYHLTPLNGMYPGFLQFPISQFLASTFIGIVLGTVFVKYGYETTVLSHTLSDWIPYSLFSIN